MRYQWPLRPGKSWEAPYLGSDFDTLWDVKAGDWMDLTVPAGTFRVIKISLERTGVEGSGYIKQEVMWFAPAVKRHVKVEIFESKGGYKWAHSVEEMTKFELGQR